MAWVAYSDAYVVPYPDHHPFRPEVSRVTRDLLLQDGVIGNGDLFQPSVASEEQILLVHDSDYLRRLQDEAGQEGFETYFDTPVTQEILQAFLVATGGTIQACRRALESGKGANLAGGYHHAHPDHGEGFCLINDIAIAIRALQTEGAIRNATVIDLDVHQGNGTAVTFAGDPSVFTLSIHEEHNYPVHKPPSDLDVSLAVWPVSDAVYLGHLEQGLAKVAASQPQSGLVIYVAGVDPYERDQLGGFSLTVEGLRRRDEMVVQWAARRGLPLCVVMAGGYAYRVEETARLHANTVAVLANTHSR